LESEDVAKKLAVQEALSNIEKERQVEKVHRISRIYVAKIDPRL
jgi:hypothetical protein